MTSRSSISFEMKNSRPGASLGAINAFEQTTGVKIPADYRKFLLGQNGGSPVRRNFSFGDGAYQDSILRSFFGVGRSSEANLEWAIDVYGERIPINFLPVADDEFDNLILVSQRRGSTGEIFFWNHEKEFSTSSTTLVATNLKEFLEKLEPDKEEAYTVATILFESGETVRRVLPFRFYSEDRKSVLEIGDLREGEAVAERGSVKRIAKIVYTKEIS